MNLKKKNVKTYLYLKRSQLFEKNTILPIAMQKSTQNRKLTLKCVFEGLPPLRFSVIYFFEKLRSFYIRHVIFKLGFVRVHNDFSQSTDESVVKVLK